MHDIDEKITLAEKILDYTFDDKALCAEAIQMMAPLKMLPINGNFVMINQNKRLAVLGDATLSLALCKMWYSTNEKDKYPKPLEAWASLRNDLLSNAGLAQRGEALGIDLVVIAADGNQGNVSPKMIATTVQALVGAIFQDGGERAVVHVVEQLGLTLHPSLRATDALSFPCADIAVLMRKRTSGSSMSSAAKGPSGVRKPPLRLGKRDFP